MVQKASYAKKPLVKTGEKYIANNCQNCGAPIHNDVCKYCGSSHVVVVDHEEQMRRMRILAGVGQ